jgi:hypothetical protein
MSNGRSIIEVFLIKERKSYYFGSLAAVFSVYNPEDIGFTLSYLQHANLGAVAGPKAIIRRCKVITMPRTK